MRALTYPVPGVTRRLLAGLSVSVALHVGIVLGINPRSTYTYYALPLPLQVELRHVPTSANAVETAAKPHSDLSAQPADPPLGESLPQRAQRPASVATEAPVQFPLPLDKYYTSQEVDVRAQQSNEVQLVYPRLAYQMRISGKVRLRLFINEHGALDEVSLLHATPARIFEEAALTATLALQFTPAIRNGRNVKSQKTIEVVFDPYERINTP